MIIHSAVVCMLHCTARHGSVVCTPRSSREQGRAFVRHTRLTRVSATSVNLTQALSHRPSLTGPLSLAQAFSHCPGLLPQALSHRPSLTGPLSQCFLSSFCLVFDVFRSSPSTEEIKHFKVQKTTMSEPKNSILSSYDKRGEDTH